MGLKKRKINEAVDVMARNGSETAMSGPKP